MGGDPNPAASLRAMESVVEGGADILEIGIPFSDPIADGRSIQSAAVRALGSSTTPSLVLEMASKVKDGHGTPVVIMTYFNPVLSAGVSGFLDSARKKGVDGIIVPDLPLEEASEFGRAARKRGIDSILLAAPTTGVERMKEIVKNTSGFLYLVSVLGVTGARRDLKADTLSLVRSVTQHTRGKMPLAVGFGISRPEHVKAVVGAGADAAIVGSAVVDLVGKTVTGEEESLLRVEDYVRSMKQAAKAAYPKAV